MAAAAAAARVLVTIHFARVVVGTGHPLLFHFSYYYYPPGYTHPGSSMRDIATLSAPQNPRGVDGQILTPWKLSHARRARHVPMPIGHSFAGLPAHPRRHNPQKWLVPLYRMTTCACGSGQHSPSPWPSCATHVQWCLLPCARTRLCTRGGAKPPPTTMQCAGLCSASPASMDIHRLVREPQLRNRGMPSSAATLATNSLRRRGPGHAFQFNRPCCHVFFGPRCRWP